MQKMHKKRECCLCGNYDMKVKICEFFDRKLPKDAFCVVDEDTVYFISKS